MAQLIEYLPISKFKPQYCQKPTNQTKKPSVKRHKLSDLRSAQISLPVSRLYKNHLNLQELREYCICRPFLTNLLKYEFMRTDYL
jgi:hypothetical protein